MLLVRRWGSRFNYIITIKHWSTYISTTLGPLTIKAATALKALQLMDDLYKLSQLSLAVTAFKAVQLLEDLNKLSNLHLSQFIPDC